MGRSQTLLWLGGGEKTTENKYIGPAGFRWAKPVLAGRLLGRQRCRLAGLASTGRYFRSNCSPDYWRPTLHKFPTSELQVVNCISFDFSGRLAEKFGRTGKYSAPWFMVHIQKIYKKMCNDSCTRTVFVTVKMKENTAFTRSRSDSIRPFLGENLIQFGLKHDRSLTLLNSEAEILDFGNRAQTHAFITADFL